MWYKGCALVSKTSDVGSSPTACALESSMMNLENAKKLVGKDIGIVTEKLKDMQAEFRVYRKNGLITADYHPERLSIESDDDGIITDAWYG